MVKPDSKCPRIADTSNMKMRTSSGKEVAGLALTARALHLVLVSLSLSGSSTPAGETPHSAMQTVLAAAPAAEVPARVAETVRKSKPRDRAKTTAQAVEVAVSANPACACSVVAAVSKASPDMAAVAAGAAVELQPKQAAAIARAAAAAAPGNAEKIVTAVCRVVPHDYKKVALAVAEAVPGAAREILMAVTAAIPALKPAIEAALGREDYKAPSVPTVLGSLKPSPGTGTGAPVEGTAAGPPSTSLLIPPATPPGADPQTPGPAPRGHRNYAAP